MTITPRSAFYNIEPIGLQTGMCESLSSYLMRLANRHNVSINKFMLKIRNFELGENQSEPRLHITNYYQMNGMDHYASQWVCWLSSYTSRKDLEYLTLLPWKNVIFGDGLIRKIQFFCEQCLHDQHNKNNVYIPLLWNIVPVKTCFIHNTPLSDRCPYCDKSIQVLNYLGIPGYCPYCQNFLGTNPSPKKVEASPCDRWITRHFSELIQNNPYPKNLSVIEKNGNVVLPIFVTRNYSESKHFSILSNMLYIKKPRLYFWRNEGLIPIEFFLRRGFFSGLSPIHFYDFTNENHRLIRIDSILLDFNQDGAHFFDQLQDLFSYSKRIILNSRDKKLPFVILQVDPFALEKKSPQCFEYIQESYFSFQRSIQKYCLSLLKSINNTPQHYQSLSQISEQSGYTVAALKILAPELCNNISSTYFQSRKTGREIRYAKEIQKIEKIIDELNNCGLEVNYTNVMKLLPKPGLLKNPIFQDLVKKHINVSRF